MMISNRLAASHVWTALKIWKLLCVFKVLTPPACLLMPPACLHGQSLCRSLDHDGFESPGSFSCLVCGWVVWLGSYGKKCRRCEENDLSPCDLQLRPPYCRV